MKLHSIIVVLIFLISSVFQIDKVSAQVDSTQLDPEIVADFLKQKKLSVNVEFGLYFSTSQGLGSGFGTYVAPQIGYQVSPRFRVSTGIKVFQSQGFNGLEYSTFYRPSPLYGNRFGSLVYVRGEYRLTDKLSISGTAYKQVDLFRLNAANQPNAEFDYQGVIMGVDYQLGENFFIHGEVEFSNGYNRFQSQNPFMHTTHNDPFRQSTFIR